MDAMTEMLTRIETKLDVAISQLSDHEARLRHLEGKAGRKWEGFLADLCKLTLAAVLGFLFAGLNL
ncbi:MAG: hypothetical protein Q4E65_07730 [Clostridia bacterium]|nr:hypothetical protein [Clostridia bacterium]